MPERRAGLPGSRGAARLHKRVVRAAREGRLGWWVWRQIIRLPWVCPANAHARIVWGYRDRTVSVDDDCLDGFEQRGSCWCGKFSDSAGAGLTSRPEVATGPAAPAGEEF